MGNFHESHSTEANGTHSATESHTASAATYTCTSLPTQTPPLFVGPSPQQEDDKQKAENNEIPDGGIVAWTQVLTGHLVVFNVWGYITS